jgi:CubicO group peptidase (beta-lactamase class C family)
MTAAPRRAWTVHLHGWPALSLTVVALLAAVTVFAPSRRAVADGPPADQVVAAAVAAYGQVGSLGVFVAHQEVPVRGLSLRAAEARSTRLAGYAAGNGPAADRPFPTASIVKLFVAEDILHRARAGRIAVSPHDVALLQEMIRSSNDPAASTLWERFGGGQMVADVAARYGLAGTAPPDVPGEWGEARTTARDLGRFLARLPTVAHPDDAAALLSWMQAAAPLAADGFDQRFGLFGIAPGTPAVKQGWMCCVGGNRHLHSVGVVGSRVVVLLSELPRRLGYDTGRAALSAAAGALPPVSPGGG